MSIVEFKIGNVVIKKNVNCRQRSFKKESLKNRTPYEIEVENILSGVFVKLEDFFIEHVFQFRRFDFYFPKIKLALEIDGEYHDTYFQREYDNKTDQYLKDRYSIRVVRILNKDVASKIQGVIDKIKIELSEKKLRINNNTKNLTESEHYKYIKTPQKRSVKKGKKTKNINKHRKDLIEINPFKPKTITRKKAS